MLFQQPIHVFEASRPILKANYVQQASKIIPAKQEVTNEANFANSQKVIGAKCHLV